ncbi:Tetratricopeptide domain protein [Gloeothece citriformis PCC 7424]|uniref:Tetratricopeptide domain protein n=1 Tax=Gloeothece citriformis (strain PCC 7424) TaxID=65393 RepID=B7KHC3_GLOC7|nr:Sll0314/Alr1548 family TPR repeat-containing protein [Gloeothece citriformis]ACK69332.1 Tetratricopeptide domain protein [Gloeothece citriformis PCC 7424]
MIIQLTVLKRIAIACSVAATVTLGGWVSPTLAGDPFRTSNPRNIGDKTEAAFNSLFQEGNYSQAKVYLIEATQVEANEPLAHALLASLAFTEKDWDTVKTYARKTIETSEQIKSQDPVRGNLYLAVGNFLEGAYIYEKEGPVSAISRLQQVFQYLDAAEQASPNDPELNLVKGYLELMLAVNLPFSSPEEAIDRLEKYAAPSFLADRGIAMAYRDLKNYDKALVFMDKSLKANPENPELQYLMGQILRKKGNADKNVGMLKQALTYFEQAAQKIDQLPPAIRKAIEYDSRKVAAEIQQMEISANPTR